MEKGEGGRNVEVEGGERAVRRKGGRGRAHTMLGVLVLGVL